MWKGHTASLPTHATLTISHTHTHTWPDPAFVGADPILTKAHTNLTVSSSGERRSEGRREEEEKEEEEETLALFSPNRPEPKRSSGWIQGWRGRVRRQGSQEYLYLLI